MRTSSTDEVFTVVCTTLRGALHLERESIDADDELEQLPNANSINLVRAIGTLERHYDIELDNRAVRDLKTVAGLVELIRNALAEEGARR
ncbi:acyl carrier protein [Nocardia sp. NPDC004068]|uniref:acyl carrier protein n=1 Tax=Nocardia sp. NPDC004068 TaxID=3364303 RepID=UPI003695B24F